MSWVRLYFDTMSGGKMENFIFMYFGCFIGEAKKKSFMLQLKNIVPYFASDMTLFTNSLSSAKFVVGDPASILQSSLSPPTTIRILYFSVFKVL